MAKRSPKTLAEAGALTMARAKAKAAAQSKPKKTSTAGMLKTKKTNKLSVQGNIQKAAMVAREKEKKKSGANR